MNIHNIQDDGTRLIIHGDTGITSSLQDTFDNLAMGVSVTSPDEDGTAHILYTENNRDIVLNVLRDIIN